VRFNDYTIAQREIDHSRERLICSMRFVNPAPSFPNLAKIVCQNAIHHYYSYSGYLNALNLKSVKSANSSFSMCS
jgi:hypothetical protein